MSRLLLLPLIAAAAVAVAVAVAPPEARVGGVNIRMCFPSKPCTSRAPTPTMGGSCAAQLGWSSDGSGGKETRDGRTFSSGLSLGFRRMESAPLRSMADDPRVGIIVVVLFGMVSLWFMLFKKTKKKTKTERCLYKKKSES